MVIIVSTGRELSSTSILYTSCKSNAIYLRQNHPDSSIFSKINYLYMEYFTMWVRLNINEFHIIRFMTTTKKLKNQ